MALIYAAYQKYLKHIQTVRDLEYRARKSYEETGKKDRGTLWPSDVGKCHRAAILRTFGKDQYFAPSTRGLDYMNTGNYTELETLEALKHVYGARVTDQVILRYDIWSGKADFGIDIGTDNPVLIEHKTTSEKNFDTDNDTELPKKEHVGQAVTYMWLYEHIYNGVIPTVLLFYKSWGNFAEFTLTRQGDKIQIISCINGVENVQIYNYDVYGEIETLMEWYHSGELPPKLDKKYKGCTFMGVPSCPFYYECWD